MTSKEAEQTLSVIRTLMERSTRYTNLSGHAGIAAGMLTLLGSALRHWYQTPFLPTWLGVLFAACVANILFAAGMARVNGEPLWTSPAQTELLSLTPAFVAGLVLTAVLARMGLGLLLPGIWMLLWGVGALAMSFFTPRILSLLGVAFMVAGVLALFAPPANDALSMALSFGAIHLIYGTLLVAVRHPLRSATPVLQD
jgi:hypothetical protein